ncbi:hypothetical protein DT019_02820 [Streptomyces sp. SDr-06]|uniref:hypothetical protein n=1 Tax=Streptomyces sp. SDr-06 TaxID=2267702 RepID=UPI000DE80223|nr:hypothetical protein [Streptomyces sp. SDr-06]RCH70435.1 hypothetical protein DT019_02820 [Streptomyces sp. SDr-06]
MIEGTWGSDGAPAEWGDFILMKRMKWSWDELQATPMYVRRYTLDFLNALAEREQAENDRMQRQADRAQRMG